MANVLCNLPPSGEPVRYVDVIFDGATGKNRLCVDANLTVSDITIGGVYIYDFNSGLGADVIPTNSGHNGLVVVTEEAPKSKVTVFGQTMVAPGATVLLATYTVPALKKFSWKGVVVGGGQEGEFDLQISTATQVYLRNSGAFRTIILTFPEDPEASAAATIDVYVTNIGDLAKNFEATVFGHTVDA